MVMTGFGIRIPYYPGNGERDNRVLSVFMRLRAAAGCGIRGGKRALYWP